MAFSSTNLPMKIADAGIANARGMYLYTGSTDSSTQISVTGYFAQCGAGPLARSNSVAMKVGDVLVHVQSTAGRVTMHSVVSATFNQASSAASSAFVATAGYDVTVSAAAT